MKNFTFENLSFYYGKKIVLNNINFKLNRGDVVALVGPNGVGKSTLLKIIAGIIGNKKVSYNVSFLINEPAFYPYLTGIENLNTFNFLYKKHLYDPKYCLKLVDLENSKNTLYHKYSIGMKKRLGIAKCLLQDADIYLFDEPLNGLDAKSIILFRDIVKELQKNNKIVIISSHILGELDKYCNKVLVLNKNHESQMISLEQNMGYYLFRTNQIPMRMQKNKVNDKQFCYYGSEMEFNFFIKDLIYSGIQIYEIKKIENKIEEVLMRSLHD